jgi:hypothetical protein
MTAATDHVLVQLRIDSLGLRGASLDTILILSHAAVSPFGVDRTRSYSSLAGVGADWSTTSPEYRAARSAFSQTPRVGTVIIARALGTLTQRYDVVIPSAVVAGQAYSLAIAGQGVTDTTISYTALADLTFAPGDITVGTDVIAKVAHGMTSGAGPFRLSSSGTLPTGTGIAADTDVWVIAASTDQFKLATSRANALAGTAIDITVAGSGTHTLRRAQNDVVIAQLLQAAAAVSGANYTATQIAGAGETDTLRLTASAAGGWFSVSTTNPALIAVSQTHTAPSDVTLADDIAAIIQLEPAWYGLVTLYDSSAYVLAAATAMETSGRMYFPTIVDAAPVTTSASGATDVAATLLSLGRTRTTPTAHHVPAEMIGAAAASRWLQALPGKAILKFKTLAGITPTKYTDNQRKNLRDRRCNAYEQVLSDRAFFWEGYVPSTVNKFADVTRNGDWLTDQCSRAVLSAFVANEVIPYTREGIALCEAALLGVAELAASQGVTRGVPAVTAPDISEVSATDRGDRNLRDLKLAGFLAGAIQTAVPVTVVLTL